MAAKSRDNVFREKKVFVHFLIAEICKNDARLREGKVAELDWEGHLQRN